MWGGSISFISLYLITHSLINSENYSVFSQYPRHLNVKNAIHTPILTFMANEFNQNTIYHCSTKSFDAITIMMLSIRCVHISIYVSRNRFYCVYDYSIYIMSSAPNQHQNTPNSIAKIVLVVINENKSMFFFRSLWSHWCWIDRWAALKKTERQQS